MQTDKQLSLLRYVLIDHELYVKVSPIIKADYWDIKLKPAVKFIQSYYDTYKSPPTSEQVKVETGVVIDTDVSYSPHEISYAETEIEKFCKEKAIEEAILSSPALLHEGKYGEIELKIRDALTISLHREIGLDYFHDPEQRLKLMMMTNKPIPTMFIKLDEYLGGGLNRKEMLIVAAPSGVGKSLTMSNIAHNMIKQNLNVIYITLELSEEVVAKRFDSMFSGVAQADIFKNITKTSIIIKSRGQISGRLTIKRMPESTTTANHIRAYLKEYKIIYGEAPDVIVVDYLDLMASNHSISAENTFVRDKFIAEELRSIANDDNLVMITASQLNRGSHQLDNSDELSQAHIAGGISKINTTDNLVAVLQSPAMKARRELLFKLLKTRSSNGVGNQFMMQTDPSSLLMTDLTGESKGADKSLASYVKSKSAEKGSMTSQHDQPSSSGPTSNRATPSNPAAESFNSRLDINNLPFKI